MAKKLTDREIRFLDLMHKVLFENALWFYLLIVMMAAVSANFFYKGCTNT